MKILFVDSQYPMFDRASADVRMFAIVRLLREQNHDCHYFVSDISLTETRVGVEEVERYRNALRELGVTPIERRGFEQVIAAQRYDMVFFKYFYPAETRIRLARIWQPQARLVVDSVDLVYARLLAKAALSGLANDYQEAADIRRRELKTYAAADLVLTVTDDEAKVLAGELPECPIYVVSNIHDLPEKNRLETRFPSLLFIGTFTHEPNTDGVLWFVRDVWPRVRKAFPETRFRIVGGSPPPEIRNLSSEEGIDVMGYVPDTLPFLMETWVSVAPLRFGAGMKGKVGEAMAAALPVVTTRFGIEGIDLTPGEHVLVANSPSKMAEAGISLLHNPESRATIGAAGRDFIERNYSFEAVRARIKGLIDTISALPPRSLALTTRISAINHRFLFALRQHLEWRIRPKKMRANA